LTILYYAISLRIHQQYFNQGNAKALQSLSMELAPTAVRQPY
jgi:hypothetical protein